MFFLIDFSP